MADQFRRNIWWRTICATAALSMKCIFLLALYSVFCAPAVHAAFVVTTQFWEPSYYLRRSTRCEPEKSIPAFCAKIRSCVFENIESPYRYCRMKDDGKIFDICRDVRDSCEIDGSLDLDVPVDPICVPDPHVWDTRFDTRLPPGNFSFIAFDREGTKLCGCPYSAKSGKIAWQENPKVDWQRGICQVPAHLDLVADRTKFDYSNPDREIELTVTLTDLHGKPIKYSEVRLDIESIGAKGTLSKSNLSTGWDGQVSVGYRFPKFNKAQVDTIVATCAACESNRARVEIKMAPVVVGLFNGVWNAELDAERSLKILRESVEALKNELPIGYDHFYNQTGCGQPGTTCLQDLAETFIQRQKELDGVLGNRAEHFWDVLAGRYADVDSLTGKMLGYLGNAELAFASLFDATFNAMLGQIAGGWARMLSNPPTDTDIGTQLARLQKHAEAGSALVLVGHSQGNLFLNAAYDGIQKTYPETSAKAIHVGPASPTLRGPYVLADIDLVINALRIQGVSSVPLANLSLPFSRADASGHMLIGTYMDRMRNGWRHIHELLTNVLKY